MKRLLLLASILFLATLATGPASAVVEIPIVNADFEADQLPAAGTNQPTIVGWVTTPGGGDGIFRPTANDYPSGIPSGENAAYVNLPGNLVRQVLPTPLAPNTTYVLKVSVGWNRNDPFAGYTVQLRAGGDILAQDTSSLAPEQGGWVTSIVQHTTGDNPPAIGELLEIRLLAPGVQANFDDVELTSYPANANACTETLVLPFYLSDKNNPNGTNTLYAVRNLTDDTVAAEVEYSASDGTTQVTSDLVLGPGATETVALRDVPGLATDPDGFARGFVTVRAVGDPDGAPVLAGDFFQVDVGDNFATGNQLLRQSELCTDASIRFLDFGTGTRLVVYLTQPRGADTTNDPPSFTVQAIDEAGAPLGAPQPIWTSDHALDLAASDFADTGFGNLRFDFTESLGGIVYAEYSAEGRFSVGVAAQCDGAGPCAGSDCCPPGAPKALTPELQYDESFASDCEAATAHAVMTLDSFHYRDACQQTYGGALPDAVLGARVVDCQAPPPGEDGRVVVVVEACCPMP